MRFKTPNLACLVALLPIFGVVHCGWETPRSDTLSESVGHTEQAIVPEKYKLYVDKTCSGSGSCNAGQSWSEPDDLNQIVQKGKSLCPDADTTCIYYVAQDPPCSYVADKAAFDICMNQFVRNKEAMTLYYERGAGVISFLKQANVPARTLKKSLSYFENRVGALVRWQEEELTRPVSLDTVYGEYNQTIDDFEAWLTDLATKEKGPDLVRLAQTIQQTNGIRTVFTQAKSDLVKQQQPYAALVTRYKAFRQTEPAEVAKLSWFSQSASAALDAELSKLGVQLVQYAAEETRVSEQLMMDLNASRATLGWIQENFDKSLIPYSDFMSENGIKQPKLVQSETRALMEMVAYCNKRNQMVIETSARLLDGINRRSVALLHAKASAATKATLAQAAQLDGSSIFLADITARIGALWASPKQSPKLNIAYLAERHLVFDAFVQMQAICQTPTTYQQTGCIAYRRNLSRAKVYLQSTLPSTIHLQVASMRTAGGNSASLDQVEQFLATGHLREAILAHDAVLAAIDSKSLTVKLLPKQGGLIPLRGLK